MTETMALWVDDVKEAPEGCAVARTYDDAVSLMRRFDYSVLYLDHDLGDDGRTGYDLLMQMDAEARLPMTVCCISWNPVGRKRIEAALAARDARRTAPPPPTGSPSVASPNVIRARPDREPRT